MKTRNVNSIVLLASLIVTPALTAEDGYARPRLLVEASDLAKPEVAAKLVVLDARPRTDFEAARVPKAVWVDAAAWAKAFGDGADSKGWSERIGALGVSEKSSVVVYDDASAKDAARIWWILRYWGVEDARVLNGGWKAWKSAGLKTESGKAEAPKPIPAKLESKAARLATKAQVLDAVKTQKLQIIDARSEAEFCGREKTAKRAGAIPGAKHLEWSDLLEKATGRFKPAPEISKLFAEAGIDPKKPAAAHCQSGGRASVMVFALELMGADEARNYYRSWAEWGNADDTPVVEGKAK